MADPDVIFDLASKLESNIDVDKKITAIHVIQAELQAATYVVEPDAVTSALKVSLKSANQALSAASLSLLPTYTSLLSASVTDPASIHQEPHSITNHNVRTLINSLTFHVLEKLGDQKQRIREVARNALVEFAIAAYAVSHAALTLSSSKGKDVETPLGIFERIVREAGLGAKFARIREQVVIVLPTIRQHCDKYPVRPLLAVIVDLLSDADAAVRESSRSTLIGLFANASPAAKADLKKELEKRGTRKQTTDAILREVLAGPSAVSSLPSYTNPVHPVSSTTIIRSISLSRSTSTSGSRVPSSSIPELPDDNLASQPKAQPAAVESIKHVYIASRHDLETTFESMLPYYEGKETEHNWLNREQSMIKVRGLIASGAHNKYRETFVSCLKLIQDGILKCTASLRTTLGMQGVSLISELAVELGDDLNPCVEPFLMALMRMAGFTKKLIANASQEAAAAIMVNVTFRNLFLQLIWQSITDKNVAARTFACQHLVTVLSTHATHRKHAMEGHGGLELLDKCLRKGLSDQNKDVRAKSREAFWKFHQAWRQQANLILNSLDPSAKKQLMAEAPAGMADLEASAETCKAKPTTSIPPRKPGGASSAILAAKRAASLKLAQERERRKAQETDAAHSFQLAAAGSGSGSGYNSERDQEEYSTPVSKPPPSRLFHGGHRQPSPSSSAMTEAASIPLPTSPPPLDVPGIRTRTISSVSQQSSTTSSAHARPHTEETPLRLSANLDPRQRAISSSSTYLGISQPTISASSSFVPHRSSPRLYQQQGATHRPMDVEQDDQDDDFANVTQRMAIGMEEDDTVQLIAPTDVSMDLMAYNSPFKLPEQLKSSGANIRANPIAFLGRGLPAAANDSFTFPDTPRLGATAAADRKPPFPQPSDSSTPRGGVVSAAEVPLPPSPTSSNAASSPGGTPSTVRRSALPRPVSMFTHHPSPLSYSTVSDNSHHTAATNARTVSGNNESQVETNPRRRVASKSVDLSSPLIHQITSAPFETSGVQDKRRSDNSLTGNNTNNDTKHGNGNGNRNRNGNGNGNGNGNATEHGSGPTNWFMSRARRLLDVSCSPAKSKPESSEWISMLESGQADLRVFRRLAKLSSDFKIPSSSDRRPAASMSMSSLSEVVLQPGRLPRSSPTRSGLGFEKTGESENGIDQTKRQQQKVGDAAVDTEDETDLEYAIEAWQEHNLFLALFSALQWHLEHGPRSEALQTAGMVLLHKLVENQYPLFVACSREADLLQLLISLSSREKSKGVVSGCQAILDGWSKRVDPVLGLGAVTSCFFPLFPSSSSSSSSSSTKDDDLSRSTESMASTSKIARQRNWTLGLSALSQLINRLPSELIEDQLPHLKSLIQSALNDNDIDVRQSAVTVLVTANNQMGGDKHDRIFQALSPIEKEKQDLLMYYFCKKT